MCSPECPDYESSDYAPVSTGDLADDDNHGNYDDDDDDNDHGNDDDDNGNDDDDDAVLSWHFRSRALCDYLSSISRYLD